MIKDGKPVTKAPEVANKKKVEEPKKLHEIKPNVSASITNKIVQGNIKKAVDATLAKVKNQNKSNAPEAPKTTSIKEVNQLSEKKTETKNKKE